jgi:hypothetical protein
MATSVFVVHTNPVEGREDEFNDWYNNQHLADIVAVGGFARARRYEISGAQPTYPFLQQYRYLAIYEIDGDPQETLSAMTKAIDAGMHISEAMASDLLATVYEPIGSWVSDGDDELAVGEEFKA